MSRKQIENLPNVKLSKPFETKDLTLKNLKKYRKESKEELPWTQEETDALLAGVEKYGHKKWKRIIAKYNNIFRNRRRVVDLVSKYRLLKQQSSYYRTNKRDWIMVDEGNNPLPDALGQIISISTRFPYDAAKRMAKKKIRSGETSFVIRVREGNDLNNIHFYSVNKEENGSVAIKKLSLDSLTEDEAKK